MPKFINELNYDKKPYDSFDKNPAKIGYVNDLSDVFSTAGSFYNSGDKTIAVINTAYNADFTNTVYAEGVALVASPTSLTGAIQVTNAGTYSFDFTMQVNKTNGIVGEITSWLTVNDVAQPYTANKLGLAATTTDQVLTLHSHLVLNAGDKVGLYYAGTNLTISLKASTASAPTPAIASVSLEVDRIR